MLLWGEKGSGKPKIDYDHYVWRFMMNVMLCLV